jgi:hypothetical protein
VTGWIAQIVMAILLFVERLVSKETNAKDADPTAGGIRDRFHERVRKHRDLRPSGDPSPTCGACKGSCVCGAEGRDKDQVK